ncbi:MAG: homoserine dehydrogenase, partial [Lachnospiraceae bacterium]|nr:homoserine dehydrogenase [Lachnospiraceae bacterium]
MSKMQTIKAALLGYGTVGSGIYELVRRRTDEIPHKTGAALEISKILVRDAKKARKGAPAEVFTDSWKEIIEDKEIAVVIEVMGGIEPARTYILEALRAGKQVVTANKDLLAVHGKELFEAAKEHRCDLMFEAAVAGAIPIIRPLKEGLAGNHITEIMGIVNGTTNYILTEMSQGGVDFETALKDAQEKGYAERNPEADVEGY